MPEISDQTEALVARFKSAFERYLDPADNPSASWRDVEDARKAVCAERARLAKAGLLKKQTGEAPQDDPGSQVHEPGRQ